MTFEDKFWARVAKTDSIDDCWEWLGPKDKDGYGQVSYGSWGSELGKQQYKAHRLAFWLWYSWWPEICRHAECANPSCCNPYHLKDGTWQDNNLDTYRDNHRVERRDEKGRFATVYGSFISVDWKE